MSASDRGADGRDEPTAGEQDPQLKYIAPMPASRRRPAPSPDEDPTAGYAVAQPNTPESSYVRPAAPLPSQGGEPGAPVVTETTHSAPRGGWLAPLAVILVSIAALAAVYFVTQGGGETRQAAPSNPPSASAPSVAPTQPTPSQSESTSAETPSPSTATTPAPSSESAPSTTQAAPPSTSQPTSTPSSVPRSTQPARLPSGVKRCGSKIGAGATTTCGFAKNVAVAVRQANKTKGAFHVGAWSPTTKLDYRLRCTAAPVTVCTGGRAAVIYVAR